MKWIGKVFLLLTVELRREEKTAYDLKWQANNQLCFVQIQTIEAIKIRETRENTNREKRRDAESEKVHRLYVVVSKPSYKTWT